MTRWWDFSALGRTSHRRYPQAVESPVGTLCVSVRRCGVRGEPDYPGIQLLRVLRLLAQRRNCAALGRVSTVS